MNTGKNRFALCVLTQTSHQTAACSFGAVSRNALLLNTDAAKASVPHPAPGSAAK